MKQETIDRIRKFTDDRDWEQFHSAANLANPSSSRQQNSWSASSGTMRSMTCSM